MDSPFKDQLNPINEFFMIAHFYTKTQITETGSVFNGHDPLWTFYQAKQDNQYPGIIIIDENNMITPNDNHISLEKLGDLGEVRKYISSISPKARARIEELMKENGIYVPDKKEREDWDIVEYLISNNLVWRPIPKLKDPDYINTMDWGFFVERLIRWDSEEKDPRLNLIHKTQLLKGVEPRANTHSLIVLNAGVGKSIHFQIHGINYDKVTKNSFLGYAKSPKEIFKGTVDGTDLPIGIDQIEVGNWGIMDYMFNLMEYGEARISSGAVDFKISSKSPISLIANPLGDDYNAEKSFSAILGHLTDNPAIGRRFGVLAYATDYKIIETKSTSQSLQWWKDSSIFFRAVEQYLSKKINAVYHDEKLWDYLNKEIPGYAERMKVISEGTNDSTIRIFLKEHGSAGQTRVRAAAFNASMVDHLQDLNSEDFKIEDVIDHADETLLPQIIQINIESANNIVQTIGEENNLFREAYLDAIPDYMKEIVYAVEYMRRNKIASEVFMLSTTDYKPQISNYQNIGQCMTKLIKRKRGISEFNKMTTAWFNFTFTPIDRDLKITIIDMNPITIIPNIPNIPIIPNEREIENKKVQPSDRVFRVQRVSGLNLSTKIDEIIDSMSPGLKYTTPQLAAYFNWPIAEVQKLLEVMERDKMVFNSGGMWKRN